MVPTAPPDPAWIQAIRSPAKPVSGWSLLLTLLAGLANAASLAWPGSGQPLWWLQILALAVLAWHLDGVGVQRRSAFWLGWVFAAAWLAGTFGWLFISLHIYGGLAAALAVLAVFVLAAALALYYALACWLYVALAPSFSAGRALVFGACWTLAELARCEFFTGFPWGAAGYAHIDGLLAGYAPWVGVYGIGAIAAWLALSLARITDCGRVQRIVALVLLTLPSVAQMGQDGQQTTQTAGRMSITLLQGNIAQDEKFQSGSGVPDALRWYGEQLRAARTELVVTPETALPLLPRELPKGYWNGLRQHFGVAVSDSLERIQGVEAAAPGHMEVAALIGMPLGDLGAGYTNSVVGLQRGSTEPYRYDKNHLVPFGEFIPKFFKWFTRLLNIPLGDFNRGALGQSSFSVKGAQGVQRLAPNICYEDLFGEELAARFTDEANAPTIMVNISNIAWFGDSLAIDQHLQISRMRARELERAMIRATNTGATAIINHRGEVTHSLPRLTRGVLLGEVEGRSGNTLFASWAGRYGLWPVWGLSIATILIALVLRRHKAHGWRGL